MAYEIIQLGINDYEDAIDFINLVFSVSAQPTDFPKLLPAYYQPTDKHMKCHYAIKENNKICALVGIYPTELIVGNEKLKMARIGAVSTHPNSQGMGMMSELLKYSVDLIENEGYDIGFLSGSRHRYLHFGYEKCGYNLFFNFNKSILKHYDIDYKDLKIKLVEKNSDLMEYFKNLHDNQIIYVDRKIDDFYLLCRSWGNKLFCVYNQETPVGYFVVTRDESHICEINTENEELTYKAIVAYLDYTYHKNISIRVNPLDIDLFQKLGEIGEVAEIKGVKNWSIYNWEKVISVLLNIKSKSRKLQNGEVIIGIKGYANLQIKVENDMISCHKTNLTSVIDLDKTVAIRLLFGPLPPYLVISLPKEADILNDWCPLPLQISPQDYA